MSEKRVVDNTNLSKLWTRIQQYINGLTGAFGSVAVEDIVPREKGGTGADNAEEALANLGGMSKTLLWSNTSPSSEFISQTVLENMEAILSEYDDVEIIFLVSTSTNYYVSQHTEMGTNGMISCCNPNESLTEINLLRRYSVKTTGITFYKGAYDSTTANGVLIPVRIYGIKGVQ